MALPTPLDPVPVDQLAQLDYDKGAFFFGIIPLVAIGVLCIIGLAIYLFRRGKNWNELGEEMRLPDEDVIVPTTREDEPFSAARGDLKSKYKSIE
jgi:Mg2+/citrate symporter